MNLTFLVGNGGMEDGDYYWELYRDYYRDALKSSKISPCPPCPILADGSFCFRLKGLALSFGSTGWMKCEATGGLGA